MMRLNKRKSILVNRGPSKRPFLDDSLVPVPQLDLFSGQDMQCSVLETTPFTISPSMQYSDESPIEFEIPPSMSLFLSPTLFLNVTLEIKQPGEGADANKMVNVQEGDLRTTMSSYPLSSLFTDIDVKVNGQILTTRSGLYPYIAFLHLAHLTPDSHQSLLDGEQLGFKYAETTLQSGQGKEQAKMRLYMSAGKVVLQGRLFAPLLSQDKYLLNNTAISIILHQTNDKFRVLQLDGKRVKCSIKKITLSGYHIHLNQKLLQQTMQKLQLTDAVYPIKRFTVQEYQVPIGSTNFNINLSLPTSALPEYIFMMYVDTGALRGDYKKSPYYSTLSNIRFAQITLEGKNYPREAYNCMDKTEFVRAFSDLKYACKAMAGDYTWVTMDAFQSDYGMLAFTLSRYAGTAAAEQTGEMQVASLPRAGAAELAIKLVSAEEISKTVILIFCYNNKVYFNSTFICSTDYIN